MATTNHIKIKYLSLKGTYSYWRDTIKEYSADTIDGTNIYVVDSPIK